MNPSTCADASLISWPITAGGGPGQCPVPMQSAAVPATWGDAMLVPEIVL